MKKKQVLLAVLAGMLGLGTVTAQPNYRIKPVDGRPFILPPQARIASEGLFSTRQSLSWRAHSRYSYQYVVFKGFQHDDNYASLSEKIKEADYFYSSKDATILLEHNYNIYSAGIPTPRKGASIFYSSDSSALAILINNNILMKGDPTGNFKRVAKELLVMLAEAQKSCWPRAPSISQLIVLKLFEQIPHPQEAALAALAYDTTDQSSIVLLNPAIALFVDHQDFHILRPHLPGNWNYNLGSQCFINFFRSTDGHIKQCPFIDFENGDDQMPDNKVKKDGKTVLLTSSADLQLGNNTRSLAYMALYQDYMKRNNAGSSQGSNDLTHKAKDKDLYIGNSMLLLNDNLDSLLNHPTSPDNTRAGFGNDTLLSDPNQFARRMITAVMAISVNGRLQPVQLGSTIFELGQQISLSSKFRIQRLHNGQFRTIKYWTPGTYFLPGDRITY